MLEYTIGVVVSSEGTIAVNNPRVDSIEKLRPQYEELLRKYGSHDKLHLFIYYNGKRAGDISFSDLEELSNMMGEFKRLR